MIKRKKAPNSKHEGQQETCEQYRESLGTFNSENIRNGNEYD